MRVIGTAGHIDHGKSTLVHRLTGMDPDRWAEEKRRGMTIDLGFAWLTLPSGQEASIVDVPGHERFIKNMLAGAGGIDIALLVVAADEGVMPQTREHLAILDLLGIPSAVVALTKSDLVDEEWLALVGDDVVQTLEGTSLAGSPILAVSATSGRGIDDLLSALDSALLSLPASTATRLPLLPVDRVFTIAGFGTVVTGTLINGGLRNGQEIEVIPTGGRARIRNLQTHRRQVEDVEAGSRVAVNLSSLSRRDVERGDAIVVPGTIPPVRRFDARVRVWRGADASLSHGARVSIYAGSAERSAVVSILGANAVVPGASGWAQFRLRDPVAVVHDQRFIVRLPAPLGTIAGGAILDVQPRHRRSDTEAVLRLASLDTTETLDLVAAVLSDHRPRSAAQVAVVAGLPAETVACALVSLCEREEVIARGDLFITVGGWKNVEDRARTVLNVYQEENPLRRGMPREELRQKIGSKHADWPSTLRLLANAGIVREEGPFLSLPGHRGGTSARAEDVAKVLAALRVEPFSPPSGNELLAVTGVNLGLLAAMVDEGAIVRIEQGVFLDRGAFEGMLATTLESIDRDGSITVSTLRDRASTSRKYALAFLEYLDGERFTRRVGDVRVRGSRQPACA